MPQSAKVEVQFDPISEVRVHHDADDEHAKSESNNGDDFSPINYEENEDLFYENNFPSAFKRESDHR